MIYLITGVPGSGKSYYAVNYIYKELTSKDSKYKTIYTNINLNFDKCDEIKKGFVKPLILDDLLQRIQKDYELSERFKNNDLYDEETGELITDYDFYVRGKLKLFDPYEHSLIILDECHLYFTEQVDQKMLRFLSYHRHFDIDIFLITQNKSLINRKYLAFVESMLIAVNPSKRLFSKVFVYKVYASWKEYKSNYVGKEKLKLDKKIASCYNSGSNKVPKSFASKLLIPLFVGIVLLYFGYNGVKNYITCGSFSCNHSKSISINSSDKVITSNTNLNRIKTNVSKTKTIQKHVKEFLSLNDYKYYFKIVCFEKKCIVNNNFSISRYLLDYLPNISETFIFYRVSSDSNQIYYVATNFNLTKLSGGSHEKDNNNSRIFNF